MSNKVYSLCIEPSRFMDAYNLDVAAFVERHTFKESAQKGSKQINYMSYSHAYRLFRTYFPELQVANKVDPETGSFLHREIGERGYFTLPYVYRLDDETDRMYSSPEYYYPILTVSGQAVYPNELVVKKDYNTGKSGPVQGQYVADIQLFNKSIQRGLVKAIALTTGIGLKLWTGDDLDETIVDEKFKYLEKVEKLAQDYNATNPSVPYVVTSSYLDTITVISNEGRTLRTMLNSRTNTTVDVTVSNVVAVADVLGGTPEVASLAASKSKSK